MNAKCLILLVEDDDNDAFFFRRVLAKLNFPGQIQHVWDTDSARDYLTASATTGAQTHFPVPDLIIADSNVQGHNSGLEFLKWVRQSTFGDLPFVLYSGLFSNEEREQARQAGATAILVKTADTVRMREHIVEMSSLLPVRFRAWLQPSLEC